MYHNEIDISMPVFIYGEDDSQYYGCIIRIRGKHGIIEGKTGFVGFFEVNGERYDVKSIDFKDNGSGNPVIIMAGYNKEGTEISGGISCYAGKDFGFVKGNLYKFQGRCTSNYEFAAPAKTLDEAKAISDSIKPKASSIGIIGG